MRKTAVTAPPTPLLQLLYTSSLAPTAQVSELGTIARAARARNAARDITGALVFDGRRFGHYLEGAEATLLALWRRLQTDPRHVDVVLRHCAPLSGARRFPGSSLGYALAQEESLLDRLDTAWGELAVRALRHALDGCEREP